MPINTNEIYFVYSGSGTNLNPSGSLGGEPGEIITTNSIFDNLSAIEGEAGTTDYRCCYLVNDSSESTLNNFAVYTTRTDPTLGTSDVTIWVGFLLRNEFQILTITDYESISSGSIEITYDHAVFNSKTFTITISSTIDSAAIETIKETIYSNLMSLQDYAVETEITHSISGNDLLIEIEFTGYSKNKSHNLLVATSSEFTLSVEKTVVGSPINSVPDEIPNEKVAPAYVTFLNPATDESTIIGNLEPSDVCPIWLKRKVPAGSRAVTKDGFTLKARGEAISESLP